MAKISDLIPFLNNLVGEKNQNDLGAFGNQLIFEKGKHLGYSQFNEILLLLGYGRVCESFFQFLIGCDIAESTENSSIKSLEELKEGVDRFLEMALLNFGNIKFAFKTWSKDEESLSELIENRKPLPLSKFKMRNNPINRIEEIPKEKTYYLGYIFQAEIKKNLELNPDDEVAKIQQNEIEKYIKIGEKNQTSYLASDHMDIYVATSMRLPHEYAFVNETTRKIFKSEYIKDLKLRYFDPTQAYCIDRIDKGLSEGLMLKRATCTVYFAQESDTLGKDSELASTLAQGKPVIAYVPSGDRKYVNSLLKSLKSLDNLKEEKKIIIEQLKVFDPTLPWDNESFRNYLCNKDGEIDLKQLLYETVKKHYDKRAKTLTEVHPLGIQVNLQSGVANGVLVVRNVNDCAMLLRSIITRDMKFYIDKEYKNGREYLYLREQISKCIFRVKSGEPLLTNSFWNFYL